MFDVCVCVCVTGRVRGIEERHAVGRRPLLRRATGLAGYSDDPAAAVRGRKTMALRV